MGRQNQRSEEDWDLEEEVVRDGSTLLRWFEYSERPVETNIKLEGTANVVEYLIGINKEGTGIGHQRFEVELQLAPICQLWTQRRTRSSQPKNNTNWIKKC